MLLSRGRRWETTSEKRGVWPLLTDCGTCTRTRLTISRRAREAGVRAPACGPIKIVPVCDPDQILTLTAHPDKMVVSTKCACETTMRQHRTCEHRTVRHTRPIPLRSSSGPLRPSDFSSTSNPSSHVPHVVARDRLYSTAVRPPSDPILKLQTKPSPNTLDPSCACFARYSRAHRPFPLRSLRARLYA